MEQSVYYGISHGQIIAVCTILDVSLGKHQLMEAFRLPEDEVERLIRRAEEMESLQNLPEGWRFTMPDEKIARQGLHLDFFLVPLYVIWKRGVVAETVLEELRKRLGVCLGATGEELIVFFNQLGAYSEREHNLSLATALYELTIQLSRNISLPSRKSLFVRSVLNISKLEFMRGVSLIKTLKCQQEAMKMVHQNNLSAEDALLMLYTGMSEHFSGSLQEGYILREKGIKYLKQFNYMDMESEAVPLVGWHYYLLGNFNNTIAYYESMILAIENREDSDIIAFAYPPIIFSYMFLGEYHRALILSEIIYKNALEAKDHCAATLILANAGRTYVYMNDIDRAESVLYQAYAEALQEDYGWGLYYTLLGICYLQYKKRNFFACREAFHLACKAASEHGFRAICASPFVLDVLKMIEQQGMEPIEGFQYETVLQNFISSQNVHMAGASYRHLALLKEASGCSPEVILKDLQRSVQLLEESGSGNQLAETYLECARVFNGLSDREKTKQYAQLAWSSFSDVERKDFPRIFIGFVDTNDYPVNLSVLLETAWLEFRHIINPERLVARLLTSICRQLKTESAAFVQIRGGTLQPLLLQNIKREKDSPQYQRMTAIAVHVEKARDIFTVQNKQFALHQQTLDLKMNPRFIFCMPFFSGDRVGAVLYLESYYKSDTLSTADCKLLTTFSQRLSEHLFTTLDYEALKESGGKVERGEEAAGRLSGDGAYCPSIDETILLIQAQIGKIAKTKVPILITGETGVGKELFCEQIYEQGCCKGAFVKVNCGAIPESLIESELFGYERGSFTGAVQQKKGYFELAEGGTIFLDEIGELTLQTQVKLLRVLQEHEFLRVGGTKAVKVDFRLIAATNKDLREEVERGTFRKDLYYRLNIMQLSIPPLRERKADIANMAKFFVDKFCRELGRPSCRISPEALVSLLEYDWPGNVRELENTMQRAVLLSEGETFMLPELSRKLKKAPAQAEALVPLAEMERKYILKVIGACNGKIAGQGGAADILGLKRSTLISKMEKLGIKNVNYYDL